MATVGENAEVLRAMFPNIDLNMFIEANQGNELEWACDYILANPHLFNELVHVVEEPVLNNNNDDFNIQNMDRKGTINYTDPLFLNRLDQLADYFFLEKINENDSKMMCSAKLCCIFPSTRKTLIDLLIRHYGQQSLLTFLFFVDNGLIDLAAFTRMNMQLQTDYKGRSGIDVSQITHHRRVTPTQLAGALELPSHAKALKRFEQQLIELAIDSYDDFGQLSWKGKLVRDVIPAERIKMYKFECAVCCEDYFVKNGLSCEKVVFGDVDEPSSSKRQRVVAHTFCIECVRKQVDATLAGAMLHQDGLGIQCLSTDCGNPILFSHIQAYLPPQTRTAFERKLLNKNLCEAGVDQLEHCLKCDFAMSIEVPKEQDKVFRCLACRYEYCRFCKSKWSIHFGKSCEEAKGDGARQALENQLSEAIIRYCPKCKLQFVKLEACNKMTCSQCKTTQCYICRTANIDYTHFCNHFRDPDNPTLVCSQCKVKKCLLWEDYKKGDQEKIDTIMSATQVNQQ